MGKKKRKTKKISDKNLADIVSELVKASEEEYASLFDPNHPTYHEPCEELFSYFDEYPFDVHFVSHLWEQEAAYPLLRSGVIPGFDSNELEEGRRTLFRHVDIKLGINTVARDGKEPVLWEDTGAYLIGLTKALVMYGEQHWNLNLPNLWVFASLVTKVDVNVDVNNEYLRRWAESSSSDWIGAWERTEIDICQLKFASEARQGARRTLRDHDDVVKDQLGNWREESP